MGLGDETFPVEDLGPVIFTQEEGTFYNTGLKVEQTAYLSVEDHLEGLDEVDLICISTVYNSSIHSGTGNLYLYNGSSTISLSKAGCVLPLPVDLKSSAWGCDGLMTGGKVGEDVSCSFRCGQGGTTGVAQCKGIEWDPEISTDCDYDNGDVFTFFDAESLDFFTNPPNYDFFDPSLMQFTSPQEGLYLFGMTAANKDGQLDTHTAGVLAKMHSDSGTCST